MNKKINTFALVLSSLLIFSACNFSSNSGTKNIEKDGKHFVISGDILTGGQRSASTSFTLTSSHIIEITATHNADGVAADSTKATATVTGNKYSIVLDAPGEWNMLLTISVKNEKTNENDILYSVNGTINITDEGKILDPNGNQLDSSNINFTIRPDFGLSCPGSINLKIKDESGKIKKVSYSAELNGTSNTNSLSSVSEVTFENNEATISRNEVYPNSYKVKFNFDDDAGNTLYSCYEIVTVTAGFATDTWIGNGAHIRKDTRTGTTEFVITNTLIEKFGTDVVPDTPMLLFSSVWDSENGNEYSYSLLEKNNDAPVSQSFSSAGKNSFCFDSKGYYYAIAQNSNAEDYTKIYSNNPEFSGINDSMFDFDLGSKLAVDRKTDYLYMFDSSNAELNQLTQDDGTYSRGTDNRFNSAKTYRFDEDENRSDIQGATVFAIYDDVVYFCGKNSIVTVELNNATAGTSEGDYNLKGSAKVDMPDFDSQLEVTDALYQDGNLYIMIKESKFNFGSDVNNFGMTNRGAIIRYSLFTRTFSAPLGLTDESNGTVFKFGELAEENEKFLPVYGGYPVYYADTIWDNQGNGSLSEEKELPVQPASAYTSITGYPDNTVDSFKFNTPLLSNIESQFCGPQKFVAIKPKKLVIADSGIAFYTDAEGIWKYKNINRIVTVDLESFSIEANPKESPVNFNEKKTIALYLQASAYEAGMELSGHEEFYNTNGAGSYYSFNTPYAYAGITNGDD